MAVASRWGPKLDPYSGVFPECRDRDAVAQQTLNGLQPIPLGVRLGDPRQHDPDVVAAKHGDALVAMGRAETFEDGAAQSPCCFGERLELGAAVVGDQ